MNAVNLHATAKGDFTLASSLSPDEAVALRNQLSTNEILEELSDEAREAVLEAYDLRAYRTPQGHVVVVVSGISKPTVTQARTP